jgi:hypothetical protein
MKKILGAVLISCLAVVAKAQSSGEPIKAASDIQLSGFPGCSVAPPKDGCDARIKCSGVGQIYGNSKRSVNAARKEAEMNARTALSRFYGEKQKAKAALQNASQASETSNADGSSTVKESFSRMQADIAGNSTEALLSGVQTLGVDVSAEDREVLVIVGVSCKSQAAAKNSSAAAASAAGAAGSQGGAAGTSDGKDKQSSGAKGFRQDGGDLKSSSRRRKNADDF